MKSYFETEAANYTENQTAVEIVRIAIRDIDFNDRRFQYRLKDKHKDLIPSIEKEGQLVPVILFGQAPPYKIVDGHRRAAAVRDLGWPSVRAIVHKNITDDDAYRLSFIENVRRRNFGPMDMANAVWKAQARGKTNETLTREFGLSKRQIQRYKAMLNFSKNVLTALENEDITMAHAKVFDSMGIDDVQTWLPDIRCGMSAVALKRAINKILKNTSPQPKVYIVEKDDGFRMHPMRYSRDMPETEKDHILKTLKAAIKILESDR